MGFSFQPMMRRFLAVLAVLLMLSLAGCSREDTLDYRYQDYLERIENVLERSAEPARPLPVIAYPPRRARLLQIPPFEQGLMEVWDFERCGLMPLINKRNSNLGRVLRPSQRYLYENQLWQLLQSCYRDRMRWQDEDPDFVQRVEALYQHKQQIQPLIVHQLLFAAEELEVQFSQSLRPFSPDARPEYNTLAAALVYLTRLQSAPFATAADPAQLEQQLQLIHAQPLLHSLLKSLQISTQGLNRVAELLENQLEQRPVCLNNNPTPKARILFNVLQKFYLQSLQPVIAHHSRMANQLLPAGNRLLAGSGQYTPGTEQFRKKWLDQNAPDGLWQRFQQANQRHTKAWNTLLRQCNLFPVQG